MRCTACEATCSDSGWSHRLRGFGILRPRLAQRRVELRLRPIALLHRRLQPLLNLWQRAEPRQRTASLVLDLRTFLVACLAHQLAEAKVLELPTRAADEAAVDRGDGQRQVLLRAQLTLGADPRRKRE